MGWIDPVALRIYVYDVLLARGTPPTVAEIASQFGAAPNDARAALGNLKIGKTILVDPKSGEIRMAGSFSAAETAYRVSRDDRQWWANCAWDMLGVGMVVDAPVWVSSGSCHGSGERPACLACRRNHAHRPRRVLNFPGAT